MRCVPSSACVLALPAPLPCVHPPPSQAPNHPPTPTQAGPTSPTALFTWWTCGTPPGTKSATTPVRATCSAQTVCCSAGRRAAAGFSSERRVLFATPLCRPQSAATTARRSRRCHRTCKDCGRTSSRLRCRRQAAAASSWRAGAPLAPAAAAPLPPAPAAAQQAGRTVGRTTTARCCKPLTCTKQSSGIQERRRQHQHRQRQQRQHPCSQR